MVVGQGEVWWAHLRTPTGSEPGFRRPVVVVQGDALNRSRLATAVCVPLTSNLRWADAPGNMVMTARVTGLPKDSVANGSQVVTLDKTVLTDRVGKLPRAKLELILAGIDVVTGEVKGRQRLPPGRPRRWCVCPRWPHALASGPGRL